VYDISGADFTVRCCPILPEHIELDEQNNILVHLSYVVGELWNVSSVEVRLDTVMEENTKRTHPKNGLKKSVRFSPTELRLIPYQTVILKNQGIPRIHTKHIYDVSVRSDIILHIHLRV
jgi:hypothetical protein